MIKKILFAVLLVVILLYTAGCASKTAKKITEPKTTPAEKATTATEGKADIDTKVSEVDALNKEINTDELEGIDKELEGVAW